MIDALQRKERALTAIKTVVDSYTKNGITVTADNDDFDVHNHTYDLSVIMGIIQNHTYEGLGLPIPKQNKKKGEPAK